MPPRALSGNVIQIGVGVRSSARSLKIMTAAAAHSGWQVAPDRNVRRTGSAHSANLGLQARHSHRQVPTGIALPSRARPRGRCRLKLARRKQRRLRLATPPTLALAFGLAQLAPPESELRGACRSRRLGGPQALRAVAFGRRTVRTPGACASCCCHGHGALAHSVSSPLMAWAHSVSSPLMAWAAAGRLFKCRSRRYEALSGRLHPTCAAGGQRVTHCLSSESRFEVHTSH